MNLLLKNTINHNQLVRRPTSSRQPASFKRKINVNCQRPQKWLAGMNRPFVYDIHNGRPPSVWSRTSSTLNKWLWGALCCGVPGVPCYFCNCCPKIENHRDRERTRVHQSTGTTAERIARPHRPHAPGGRKSTPEMLSAVRCALTQLQGEPAPPLPLKSSQSETQRETQRETPTNGVLQQK